jgi:outer membrane protein TolC
MHATTAALFLVAAGCALKSPPNREALDKEALGQAVPPAQWNAGGDAPGAVAGGWLRSFNEPRLDALVNEALARNALPPLTSSKPGLRSRSRAARSPRR